MIRISTVIKNEIIRHCNHHYPNEACGIMNGVLQNSENIRVSRFQPIANVSKQPKSRFQMDPHVWIDALYSAERDKEPIVGIIHSHPNCAASPSDHDLQTAWHMIPSYWIVSLMDRHNPVIKAYKIRSGHADGHNKISSSPMYEEIPIVYADEWLTR